MHAREQLESHSDANLLFSLIIIVSCLSVNLHSCNGESKGVNISKEETSSKLFSCLNNQLVLQSKHSYLKLAYLNCTRSPVNRLQLKQHQFPHVKRRNKYSNFSSSLNCLIQLEIIIAGLKSGKDVPSPVLCIYEKIMFFRKKRSGRFSLIELGKINKIFISPDSTPLKIWH